MILRRLSQHLREQNWTAISIEFVLLVAGVFLGIQVANWNEDRQQAERQTQYLERLQVDFVGIRDRIREHFVVYEETLDGSEYLLTLVRAEPGSVDGSEIDTARIASGFAGLMSNRIPPPLPATYVEMRSEGQLSYIANPELRDQLAEYDRLLGVLQEVSRVTGDNLTRQAPIVLRYFSSRTVRENSRLSGVRDELVGYDLAGMRADRDFTVAVGLLQRYAINSLAQREIQLELIERILALIEAEIAT